MYKIEEIKNTIITGNALEILPLIPSDSIDTIITSPPYYNCRDYLPENSNIKSKEIGNENHPQQYIDNIIQICTECIRTLKKTGTFFLNIGDVFYNPIKSNNNTWTWLKPKQRLLLPLRIAIALQEKNYIIRDILIWAKKITRYPEKTSIGTTTPFPVKDRFLHAYEYIFQIVKSPKYYFNLQNLKIPLKNQTLKRAQYPVKYENDNNPYKKTIEKGVNNYFKKIHIGKTWNIDIQNEISLANPTNVLMFKTANQYSVPNGHFAKFPISLVETLISATCPPNGIILDPFMGSGTTAVAAIKLNKNYIGIEINPQYVQLAYKRIQNTQTTLNIL